MKVDESFAEFVSARWSMLYRLATLLVGEDRADEVAQAALARAYVAWPEIREPAPTDDLAKAILAKTALASPPPGTDEELPAPQTLWGEIGRLLPRQRAVLVLRHYEVLSDAEIAHTLGCSPETVAAEALALETGVDLEDLRDELVQRAHDAEVPLPPIAAVLAQGRQARRRRARRGVGWAAGTAALVVAGLALGNLVQATMSGKPEPARPTPSVAVPRFVSLLPRGALPRIAYSVGRTLNLDGGREVALDGKPSAIVQTRHWLFVAYLSGAIVRVDTGDGTITTVVPDSQGEVVTDPSGNRLAWLAAGPGPAVVAVQSVDAASVPVSDRQEFPATPRCCDNPFVVDGITQDGQVIASLPAANQAWVWNTPDGGTDQLREISGLGNGVISQVTAEGVVAQYLPSHFAVGVLEDDVFLVRDEINARQADFGDPRGVRVLYVDDAGEIHVRERAARGRSRRPSPNVRLGLPTLDQGYTSVRWEDADHVLLDVADASTPDGALVRCDVRTGACQIAVTFDGPHLVAD